MFTWSLWVPFIGVLSALLLVAILTRLVDRRVVPGRACLAGSVIGFCGWVAFLLGYRRPWPVPESLTATVWLCWCALAVSIIPLEAGLLGWFGTSSRWRWFVLGTGVALALLSNLGAIFG
jgi:hypothetical protein